MQTFLPYPDFERSLASLDDARSNAQRREARQILKTLTVGGGWRHHPAVKMWRGYEDSLTLYSNLAIKEWIGRGKRHDLVKNPILPVDPDPMSPPWLGDERFHSCHRARLLFKNPAHYGQLGWTERPLADGYLWPLVEGGRIKWRDLRLEVAS